MAELQPTFFCEGEQDAAFVESIIMGEDSDILVLEADGQLCGFVVLQAKETAPFSFFVKHRYAYLMDIIVAAADRGKGYGKALMDAAKAWAINRNLAYIELDVLSNNANAIAMYAKYGYQDKRKSMFLPLA